MIDPVIQYLTRQRPWEPWHPETNPGLCHDYNPLLRDAFENKSQEWWEGLDPNRPSSHAAHRDLVSSFTMFMGEDYGQLVWKHHKRLNPKHDGLIEEAGTDILSLYRCGFPDFMIDEGEATGSGSWRPGCLGNNDRHEVYIHINDDRMPSATREWWGEILDGCQKAYREVGWNLVETKTRSLAHILISWEVLPGPTIGLAQLPGSGHCHTGYFCKLDPGYQPSLNQVMKLLMHELGHTANSGHLTGDELMHPAMGNSFWNGIIKGAFRRRCDQFFGGQPIPSPGPTPPGPPGDVLSGLGTVIVGGKEFSVTMIGTPK